MNERITKVQKGNMKVVTDGFVLVDFRFKYKDEYEKFKFIVNGIGLLMSLINILINSR